MMVYYTIFVLMAITLAFRTNGAVVKLIVLFWMSVLSLMAGFRYDVGTDWLNYVEYFQMCPDLSHIYPNDVNIEWGGYLLMAFVKSIGGGPELWFFIMSAISFAAIYRAMRVLFPQVLGSALLIYYCFFFLQCHFNIVRQGTMASFVWLALSYVPQHKLKAYLLWMLVATSIHISALVFIPLFWLINRKYKPILTWGILIALFAVGIKFQKLIFNLDIGLSIIGDKVEYYTENYYQGQELNDNLSIGTIAYTIVYLWISLFSDRFKNVKNFNLVKNALFFSLCILFSFRGSGVFAERFGMVLNISLIFIIPLFITVYKGYVRQMCRAVLLLYCILLLSRNLSSENSSLGKPQFIPYITIFNRQ